MQKTSKKQCVLIMTDTTRRDMLGCYGNSRMKTPNLDRLAKKGIRYDNAYSCQPVCGPARSSIFTGLSPHSNGVVSNCVPLGENVRTLGQMLTDNSIHSVYIGKWHLDASDYFGSGIAPQGWDRDAWYDMKCYLGELTPEQRLKSRQSQTAFDESLTEDFTYAHRCTGRAVDFLDKHSDENFMLVVSYDEPHGPCICPAPWNRMYENFRWDDNPNFSDDLSKKPLYQSLWAKEAVNQSSDEINKPSRMLSLFLGCNSFVDREIGIVLDKLEQCCPDALIIYTSDHGDMLGNHRLQMKNAACYREIANIPLIIKGGARGAVCTHMASHVDITPTILDYFGIPVPKIIEGKSMLSQLYNPDEKINEAVFTEWTRYEQDHDGFGGLQLMRAVTTERYKLVIHLCDTDEFYDLEKDPYEVCNLINSSDYEIPRNHLHDLLLEHMNITRDVYRGYQWECREWRKDRIPRWENDGYTRQRNNEPLEPRPLDYDTGLEISDYSRPKTTNDMKN